MPAAELGQNARRLVLSERELTPDEVRDTLAPFGFRDAPAADGVIRAMADMQASRESLADFLPALLDLSVSRLVLRILIIIIIIIVIIFIIVIVMVIVILIVIIIIIIIIVIAITIILIIITFIIKSGPAR